MIFRSPLLVHLPHNPIHNASDRLASSTAFMRIGAGRDIFPPYITTRVATDNVLLLMQPCRAYNALQSRAVIPMRMPLIPWFVNFLPVLASCPFKPRAALPGRRIFL